MISSVEVSELPEPDEVGQELAVFVQTLRKQLAKAAEIEIEQLTPRILLTKVVPRATNACPVSVVEMDKHEMIVNVGSGRWELGRSMESLGFFKNVVGSSINGDVVETIGLERVETRVTLPDGKVAKTTTRALGGIIPTHGWRHWGRKVRYEPYQNADAEPKAERD